jgi:prepilin-type N-terminal cleavage/methylation domain-containing protein
VVKREGGDLMKHQIRECGNLGFTLIELMVTIAIILSMAALLMPVIQKVKSSTRDNVCANNLRQLGIKLQDFVGETGEYPLNVNRNTNLFRDHRRTWLNSIYGTQDIDDLKHESLLTSGILRCPGVKKRPSNWPDSLPDNVTGYNSYSYNSEGFRLGLEYEHRGVGGKMVDSILVPVKVDAVRNPSSLALLGDAFAGEGNQIRDGMGFFRARLKPETGDEVCLARVMGRHRKSVVANFADGHVGNKTIQIVYVERSSDAFLFWNRDGAQ